MKSRKNDRTFYFEKNDAKVVGVNFHAGSASASKISITGFPFKTHQAGTLLTTNAYSC